MSDGSEDADDFRVIPDPIPSFTTREDRDLDRIQALARHLRPHPLWPADPSDPSFFL